MNKAEFIKKIKQIKEEVSYSKNIYDFNIIKNKYDNFITEISKLTPKFYNSNIKFIMIEFYKTEVVFNKIKEIVIHKEIIN